MPCGAGTCGVLRFTGGWLTYTLVGMLAFDCHYDGASQSPAYRRAAARMDVDGVLWRLCLSGGGPCWPDERPGVDMPALLVTTGMPALLRELCTDRVHVSSILCVTSCMYRTRRLHNRLAPIDGLHFREHEALLAAFSVPNCAPVATGTSRARNANVFARSWPVTNSVQSLECI